MKGNYHSCRREYWRDRITGFISDGAREDIFNAVHTAIDRLTAPNIRLSFQVDDGKTDSEKNYFQRRVIGYYASFAYQCRFSPVVFCCRHNDFGTNSNNKLSLLAFIPNTHLLKFERRYRKWPELYDAMNLGNSAAMIGEFEQVYSAISPQLHAALPNLPFSRSGIIRGPRTFYSRSLWWNNR